MRVPVYYSQAVTFKGPGFTKAVVPPPIPAPPTTKGETAGIAFEKTDEYAEKAAQHDRNVKPYCEPCS